MLLSLEEIVLNQAFIHLSTAVQHFFIMPGSVKKNQINGKHSFSTHAAYNVRNQFDAHSLQCSRKANKLSAFFSYLKGTLKDSI